MAAPVDRPVLRRLWRETGGQSMLETIVVLPVILLLLLMVMQVAFAYNAKQLADYAAYCAARVAAVRGPGAEAEIQRAAALALTGVPEPLGGEYFRVRNHFRISENSFRPVQPQLSPEGDMSGWLRRFAAANLRVLVENVRVSGDGSGRSVTVEVAYLFNCLLLPLGTATPGPVSEFLSRLERDRPGLASIYADIRSTHLRRNIIIRGRATLDHWAGNGGDGQ